MSTDWKPGDVAMVTWVDDYDGDVQTAVRVMVSNGTTDDAPGQRRPAWWGGDGYLAAGMKGLSARPLVVIDPEDRKQVDRLADALIEAMCKADTGWDKARAYEVRSHMRTALIEFANPTPPKPDEPQGLGAVVEDAAGDRWVLVTGDDEFPWAKVPAGEWQIECFAWHEFDAVRVVSEGVRP